MPPPRRTDPNVNVRNNLTASKVNKRPFNPRNGNNLAASAADSSLNRPGMIHSGILSGILLMIVLLVVFLLAHFETNRHLKEITQNIDKSRKGNERATVSQLTAGHESILQIPDLLNLTQHLTTMSEDVRMGGQVRPIVHRIDHAQFTLGAKVIKLQGIELPMTGPTNEQVRNLLGISVPKTACNILGRYLDRKNFLVFKGDKAIITIRLHQPIFPDTIRIDHYIENLQDFKIVKAVPKDISVYVRPIHSMSN